jgi:uncharacterized radical SAM protein YgiQ
VDLVQLRNKHTPPRERAQPRFLPTTREEMEARGWDELDVLLVTGDAYVDHPAFGPVLIARFLEGRGYRVGIVAQPRWDKPDDIARMGRPRLFVGISAGNLDSMLNKLTAQKKMRSEDQYSPGGAIDMRPNRATIVYSNLCRQAFATEPRVPIVLGGIEASLRRIAHYDYWSDQVRRSILLDAKADLLVFGMGERPAWEIARRLEGGQHVDQLTDIRGTAHVKRKRAKWEPLLAKASQYVTDGKLVILPSYEEVTGDKKAFALMSRQFQYETNPHNGRPLLQVHGEEAVYFNPPAEPLTEKEMDGLYDLPFTRLPHPSYAGARIPAYETVKHSIVTMRGCFGGCTFCSITEHEGRIIQSRSGGSGLRERPPRSARSLADGWLPRHDHRSRRPDGQHVQDDVQGRAHRKRLPPPLVRAPWRLRKPGHRSRAAHRADEEGPQGAGDQAGLYRERGSLRSRRAEPGVRARACRAPHGGPALGRPRAQLARGARQDEEAPD